MEALRLQRLRLIGVIGQRAKLLAGLAWGGLVMNAAFDDHRTAALAVLTSGAALRPKEGAFLGQLAFDANPPTEKQANWLRILLERTGLPPMNGGAL